MEFMYKISYPIIVIALLGVSYISSAHSENNENNHETETIGIDIRFGAKSIYEENKHHDPFFSDSRVIR
jgi:hypothetical protein